MHYHPNSLIDAAVAASVKIAKRSKNPAATLMQCLSIEADDPRWTREEAVELMACEAAALAALAEPKGGN